MGSNLRVLVLRVKFRELHPLGTSASLEMAAKVAENDQRIHSSTFSVSLEKTKIAQKCTILKEENRKHMRPFITFIGFGKKQTKFLSSS